LKFTLDDKYIICGGADEVGIFTYYGKMLKKTKAIWDPKMAPQSALSIGLMKGHTPTQEEIDSGMTTTKGGLIATGMYLGWRKNKYV